MNGFKKTLIVLRTAQAVLLNKMIDLSEGQVSLKY